MRTIVCKNCGKSSSTTDRKKKFCNRSCSAIYNNTHKLKKDRPCENCGKQRSRHSTRFCCIKCQRHFEFQKKLESGKFSTRMAKKHLMDIDNRCSICKIDGEWNGKPLMLILDHINGNAENNDLSNLRLVCPNCDSQLDTFKSRNRGNGRHSRRTRYNLGMSY
jgi:hypothetical protein